VDHGDAIKPAYGYRIEYQGRVAVISGDTRYNANVLRYGEGADLLVHEVAMARPELLVEGYIQRIVNHHTSPQEAGRVFAQTRPKLAAFTHLVMLASEKRDGADRRRVDRGDTRDLCGTAGSRRGPDELRDR
jgi:ribonuclease Z